MMVLAPTEILLGLLAVLLAVVAWFLFVRIGRLQRELAQTRQELRSLSGLLNAQSASTSGLHRRLLGLEQRLATKHQDASSVLSPVQESPVASEETVSANQPYAEAIARIHQGASVQELRSELGLSRDEAELLCRLHGKTSAA